MCRIDERVYVRTDGHRSVFQDKTLCEKGRRHGKMCSDPKVRRTEYQDPTSSPMASSPVTPSYNTRTRRPSVSSRPSTRDGPIESLKPGIHIEIGAKKGKGKSYLPTVSITTGKTKRTSTGSASGSDASHTVRTGYPDISPPPLDSNHGRLHPSFGQQWNPSSDESFVGSSRVPSLYDYDSPSLVTATTGTSSGNHPIIHNGARRAPTQTDTTRGHTASPASPYHTTEFVPSATFQDTSARTERDQRHASSYAPEITGRDEDRQRRRDENKRRQEALDREVAANLVREENLKKVRFETDRPKHRADERAQNNFAAHEQRRTDDRERLRQQKKEQEARAAKEAAAKEAAAREAAAREAAAKRSKTSATKPRRGSVQMTASQAAEQQHLVKAEVIQMQQERLKAEAIEREEQRQHQALLQQQRQPPSLQERQLDPGYYDPRAGRPTPPTTQPPIIRRPSQSNQPRPDIPRRLSTHNALAPQPRTERRQAPLAYYNNTTALPQAREHRPSSSHANNPFAAPAPAPADPWDVRNVRSALPNARGPQLGHNFPAQQATHRMNQAFYQGEYETDSEDEVRGKRR
ncbi:hypothetical protein C7974DRAFT_85623 [Boeremia exigua]|uniref:uncharacterized protein n=1 Tax=Boeremia exigua TaxID=749465 RepID=UPI001E8E64D1|nr:uncharacterized protein C7974DRAFT_85623 [Boeremia exigua]KAH6611839.1 hypothetical protein C7974DRAFT_85623 [Boeremia exigua]